MIANLSKSFGDKAVLSKKISYNIDKIEKGVGEYLYDSFYNNDITKLYNEMQEVALMNDRVKSKYIDISLNLQKGEHLSNEVFLKLAQEYLEKLGYKNSCYAVIRHTDKEHEHLHILATNIDYDGNHINDSYTRFRSQTISRELEQKYGLGIVEYSQFNNESLSKIKEREYYYSNALMKGLRSFATKKHLQELLGENAGIVQKERLTNTQLEVLLGDELYNKIGGFLEKNNLFATFYKNEILQKLDSCYELSQDKYDFLHRISEEGIYARVLTGDESKPKYVYGLVDSSIYFNDALFPLKYRYNQLSSFVHKTMSNDEQKKLIASKAILALKGSKDLESFISSLKELGIKTILHTNKGGPYGLSFELESMEQAVTFKASDIDRSLSINNLNKLFTQPELHKEEKSKVVIDTQEQINIIISEVQNAYSKARNVEELQRLLSEKEIDMWIKKKTDGKVVGYSFKVRYASNAESIKASDIVIGNSTLSKDIQSKVEEMNRINTENTREKYQKYVGYMTVHQQKEYIQIAAQKCMLNNPTSIAQFASLMQTEGVNFRVRTDKETKEVKGFSFKMLNIQGATPIKARDISKEFDIQLFEVLAPDSVYAHKASGESYTNDYTNSSLFFNQSESYIDAGNHGGKSHEDDGDLSKRKKKKRKKNMDLEK